MDIAVLIIGIISLLLAAAQVYYGRLSARPSPAASVPEPRADSATTGQTHPCYYLLLDGHPIKSMRSGSFEWGDRSHEYVSIGGGTEMYFDASDFDRPHIFVLRSLARGTYPVRIRIHYANDKPQPTTHVADLVLGDSMYYRMRWQPSVTVEPSREEHLRITAVSEAEIKSIMGSRPLPNCASSPHGITYTN
ncbi:MAG TPA: hypothetical protein VH740_17050 [Vicinamibacterales bacterium]|jgi:hypothetical protein